MRACLSATPSELVLTGADLSAGAAVGLLLGGRRIWTFRAPAADGDGALRVAWPPALADRLSGRAELTAVVGEEPIARGTVRFGDGDDEMQLVEPGTGVPQVINKWGRIAHSFEGRDSHLLEAVLDETERLVQVVSRVAGLDLFVTGGTLLGPVRDGRILPHDDDADLAYLSRFENPSDVALESFALERALVGEGYEVLRHSTGHLQLMFPGGSVTDDFYIDIFTYFVCNGFFYGTFHARERAELVPLLPTSPLDVNGRSLPGPADPAALLAAIYGPGWRTPDPSFSFVTPPAAARRFFWWLNHFDFDRENWDDHHRTAIATATPRPPSDFADAVGPRLTVGGSVLELGCGLGDDAVRLAEHARAVLAVDYSRPAVVHARSTHPRRSGVTFELANLNMVRQAVTLRHRSRALPGPVDVYARRLFNALSPLGWDVALDLTRHVLAAGGSAFFEVQVGEPVPLPGWNDHGPVDWRRFQDQLERYGLRIVEQEIGETQPDGTGINRVIVRSDEHD